MNKRLIIYISCTFVIGLLTQSCEKTDKEIKPEFSLEQADLISDENYNIYSLVIEEMYSSEKIVIAQATKTSIDLNYDNYFYDYLVENHQDFDTILVKTHGDLNENSVNFGEQFHDETKEIILITSEELSYVFDSQDLNRDWEEFYNDYENSNGIIRFSRIAYNDDKTQAIFEIGHSYASLGGGGSIIYLKKQDGIWTITEVIPTWIS
ncbi:hypothetical protein [Saccharicrinis fermentans]|uniref:Uncharacterized protein n=1 Tax=Saccharicrinis fermentans DSM 9555 = JCM 21142 TaxID=869213 RepID=W7Y5A5_9BACT|nr:hypothetical protein [Saccharicrinis fermentans]GAF02733.1 hypothetical protein JCM21142_41374 [Saccharicrinis fermentans DSM 9555 = JCM 21142]